jgi:predicted DNA-binding WGR domain protein
VLEIVATDPAWVSHLKPGLSWRTAAYDMGKAKPATSLHPGGKVNVPAEQGSSTKRPTSAQRKTSKAKRKPSPRPTTIRACRLEFIGGTSKKFWEVELQGKSLTTRYGRIGAVARETKNSFANAAEGQRTFDKLVAEKIAKGYREV